MRTRRLSFVAAAVAALVLIPSSAAHASCAEAPPLDESLAQADLVFVGTVLAVADDGRTAQFRVEEIWKGDVTEEVVVHGGPGIDVIEQAKADGNQVATSVDRSYVPGVRYLVAPFDAGGAILADNICSPTREYDASLDQFRPTDVRVLAGGQTPPTAVGTGDDPSGDGDDGRSGEALGGSDEEGTGGVAVLALGGIGAALVAGAGILTLRRRRAAQGGR